MKISKKLLSIIRVTTLAVPLLLFLACSIWPGIEVESATEPVNSISKFPTTNWMDNDNNIEIKIKEFLNTTPIQSGSRARAEKIGFICEKAPNLSCEHTRTIKYRATGPNAVDGELHETLISIKLSDHTNIDTTKVSRKNTKTIK